MRRNRSIPSAAVIPVLIYPDVREAVAWLSEAFGFVERVRIGENHRAQLSFGAGAVIVADVRHERRPPRPGEVTHSVLVRVDDVDVHCERARGHGARIVMEPTDFEYGERQYAAEDPAGHQWTFSETLADVDPGAWGGILVTPDSSSGETGDRVLAGTCECGTVRYTVPDAFLYAANCHCSACRAATGSAFKPFAGIEREKLELTEGHDQLLVFGGRDENHTRCRTCGSLLFSVVRSGEYAHVAMGSLVDAPSIRPAEHIFVGSKAVWFEITDDLPQHEGHAQ